MYTLKVPHVLIKHTKINYSKVQGIMGIPFAATMLL